MPAPPYDTVEMVLQSARVRLNDAIQSINGEILTDLAAFTPQVINNAWRRLQEYLADRGFSKFDTEIIFTNVPAWGATDPGLFASFDWSGYSDGANPWPAPVLPQDLITPRELFERAHGSNGIFLPMDRMFNGLPTANPGTSAGARDNLNRLWEWRGDSIYLPGALQATDIRMRYAAYTADFAYAPAPGAGWNIPVPVMRCLSSFAWFVCSEMARARADMDAGTFDQYAMDAAEQILNRERPIGPDRKADSSNRPARTNPAVVTQGGNG